jgi:hypothetical protein
MGGGALDLAQQVRGELARPAPDAAVRLAAAIRERLGDAAGAVVFYGSCLRKDTDEGVLDFYVVVDDYRRALDSALLAGATAALPPSVFYVECPGEAGTLRSKYALLSFDDFARGAAPGGFRTGIWARFCQPSLAAWARDEPAREALVETCVQAILTAVATLAPLLEGPATSEAFWQRAFAETYEREMRPESGEKIRALYETDPARYDRVLRAALAELEARGAFKVRWSGDHFEVELPEAERARLRSAWRRRRPLAKLVYVGQLLKTAFTFGDWLPYAAWKVERHTGKPVPYSERQRKYPLIFGWPILFRILRDRQLR